MMFGFSLVRQLEISLAAALAVFVLSAPGWGADEDWAVKMFDHTSHDFGVVARGAKAEHVFTIENIYEEDAHVTSVRSSCGCTKPQINRQLLKTWEKAQVTAVIDTRGFLGRKDATVTVSFELMVAGKPVTGEVQLHVHCFIRGDVVLQPGAIQFGTIAQGTAARQRTSVSYAGRDDWRIERVESANPHLIPHVVQTAKAPGQVTYDLSVTLKEDTPVGYIRDFLFLVTNDYNAQSARVPVAVEGIITSAVTVHPSPLMLGLVETGQSVTKPLVVQGAAPFRIAAVQCDDPRFKLSVPSGTKTLHLVPITFRAGQAPGSVNVTVSIQTEPATGAAVRVPVQVQITEPSSATPASGVVF
jgi:hypothetical protein